MSAAAVRVLAGDRRAKLVAGLLAQVELFDGIDREHQVAAIAAAGLLVRYEVRQLAEALLVLVDRSELGPDERRGLIEEARQILAGEVRVGILPAGALEWGAR